MRKSKREVYDLKELSSREWEMLHTVFNEANVDDLTNNLDVEFDEADKFLVEMFKITKEV